MKLFRVRVQGCYPGSRPGSRVWNSLYVTERQFPFAKVKLADCDCTVDFATVANEQDRRVTLHYFKYLQYRTHHYTYIHVINDAALRFGCLFKRS
jgi:Glutamine amidotransferases class-II